MSKSISPIVRVAAHWRLLVAAQLLLSASGCGRSGGQTLIFAEKNHEFGIVEVAGSTRHRFDFKVWDQGPVRITHIGSTCCGTKPIDPDLTGSVLEPGSTHHVDVILGREYSGERAQVVVDIETSPPSAEPIMLTVSGLLVTSVKAHPSPLVIREAPGGTASSALRLTRLRSSDIDQLELDQDNSSFPGLAIRDVQSSTDQVGHPALLVPRFVDTIDLRLSPAIALPDGQHNFECRLVWKNEGLTPTTVPVNVIVSHPYRPVLGTVFCGELARGATWERELRMIRQGAPEGVRVTSIESDVPWITAAVAGGKDQIVLRVTPTGPTGRFESVLTLRYNDSKVPNFNVTVSGLVVGE